MDVTITGGHTEVTTAVTRPMLVGNMLGFVAPHRLLSTSAARAGDVLLMAGAAAIEGSAILAEDHGSAIEAALGARARRQARRLAVKPGISVMQAARIAASLGAHAMHDPTEGGVGAAIHEMAYAAALRIKVNLDRIPILKLTRDICAVFGIDPLGLTSSGALLIAIDSKRAAQVLKRLAEADIRAAAIGSFESGKGVVAMRAGKPVRLPWFKRDELLRVSQ